MANNGELLLKHAYKFLDTDAIEIVCNDECVLSKCEIDIHYTTFDVRIKNTGRNDLWHEKSCNVNIAIQPALGNFINHWCGVYNFNTTIDYVAIIRGLRDEIKSIRIVSMGDEIIVLQEHPDLSTRHDYMRVYRWR